MVCPCSLQSQAPDLQLHFRLPSRLGWSSTIMPLKNFNPTILCIHQAFTWAIGTCSALVVTLITRVKKAWHSRIGHFMEMDPGGGLQRNTSWSRRFDTQTARYPGDPPKGHVTIGGTTADMVSSTLYREDSGLSRSNACIYAIYSRQLFKRGQR